MDGLTKEEFLERWLGVIITAQGYVVASHFVYDLNRMTLDEEE